MQQISQHYDEFLWALCVWREARGEKQHTSRLAVAHVIHNRATDARKRWPASPSGVVMQPYQFSSFNANDPNACKLPAANDASWLDSCQAVADVLAGTPDPTQGANFYHSFPLADPRWPTWAEANKQTAVIGSFHFYKR